LTFEVENAAEGHTTRFYAKCKKRSGECQGRGRRTATGRLRLLNCQQQSRCSKDASKKHENAAPFLTPAEGIFCVENKETK